ncbi:MAG: hypothetical protein L0215_20170 [Gemmataceae bacterium]|nr:hypothetical protein [Gemmataceae bacterium]
MRGKSIVFSATGVLFVAAAVAYCCGDYGSAKATIKVPGGITSAIVRDGRLYAIHGSGPLVCLDSPDANLKWLGRFDLIPSHFDVAGDKACLACQNRVYVADLAKKRIVAVQVFENNIANVGFAGPDRIVVLQNNEIQILEAANAKTLGTVSLGEANKNARLNLMGFQVQGDRLYAMAAGEKQGLVIVNLNTYQIIEHFPIKELNLTSGYHSVRDLRIQGDKAFMVCMRFSYGVWTDSFGYLDLKTRQFTSLKLPSNMMRNSGLVLGPAGHCYLHGWDGVFQYDAKGNLLGQVHAKSSEHILTMWNGSVVAAGQNVIEIMPLSAKMPRGQ